MEKCGLSPYTVYERMNEVMDELFLQNFGNDTKEEWHRKLDLIWLGSLEYGMTVTIHGISHYLFKALL